MIRFDVLGTPAPKGSNRAMLRGGRAVFVPGGSKVNQQKLQSWDAAVRDQARLATGDGVAPCFVGKPLTVVIVFRMARPGGHWSKAGTVKLSAPAMPATKPDADKLARCTLDSLQGSVFDDDSRIVELLVRKIYAAPGREGATILIDEWGPRSALPILVAYDGVRADSDCSRQAQLNEAVA